MSFSGDRRGSRGLVTGRSGSSDWLSRLTPRLLVTGHGAVTSRRSAVGASQQQQKKEQSGSEGGSGLKRTEARCVPDVQSPNSAFLFVKTLFLLRRKQHFLLFGKVTLLPQCEFRLRVFRVWSRFHLLRPPQVSPLFGSRVSVRGSGAFPPGAELLSPARPLLCPRTRTLPADSRTFWAFSPFFSRISRRALQPRPPLQLLDAADAAALELGLFFRRVSPGEVYCCKCFLERFGARGFMNLTNREIRDDKRGRKRTTGRRMLWCAFKTIRHLSFPELPQLKAADEAFRGVRDETKSV
ncbi:uncharacterized protein V6R79_016436 [Siganus canaliculatus]